MARRIKSLSHGSLLTANPYEPSTGKLSTSPYHREHRSKKGRKKLDKKWGNVLIYKNKRRDLIENELDSDLKLWK